MCKFIIRDIPLINIFLSITQGILFSNIKMRKVPNKAQKMVDLKPEHTTQESRQQMSCFLSMKNL